MGNEVTVKVSADATQATTGLNKASSAVSDFKKKAEGDFEGLASKFGAIFAGAAIGESIKGLLDQYGHLNDLSQRLGESAESLQRVGHAAGQSGADIDTVAKAFTKANINAIGAMKGNQELQDAFAALSIDAGQFVDLPLEQKLLAVAQGYESGGSEAEKMDAIIKILGKSGAEVLPLIAQGADSIRDAFGEAATLSDDAVNRLDAAGDRMTTVFENLKVAGAGALDWIINKIHLVGRELGTAGTYIANLGSGFSAAADAAGEYRRAYTEFMNDDGGAHKKGPKTNVEQVEAEAAALKEQKDAEKKADADLAKLKDENDKKAEEARIAALSSKQREKEIQIEIGALEGTQRDISNLSDARKEEIRGKLLDYYKELKTVQEQIAKDAEKAAQDEKKNREDAIKAAHAVADTFDKIGKNVSKAFKEIAEDELKKKLEAAEAKLSALEAANPAYTVDSLRQIGGGLSGVNYQSALSKVDMQKQAVDLQKQAVEHLKNIQRQLEKGDRTDLGNGGFEIS